MRPLQSMLKFRLPWDLEPQSLYISGNIHLPVFGRPLTHETRLITDLNPDSTPVAKKLYNNVEYEETMAHFNMFKRPAAYGADQRCYDCYSFQDIIKKYLLARGCCSTHTCTEALCKALEKELHSTIGTWKKPDDF